MSELKRACTADAGEEIGSAKRAKLEHCTTSAADNHREDAGAAYVMVSLQDGDLIKLRTQRKVPLLTSEMGWRDGSPVVVLCCTPASGGAGLHAQLKKTTDPDGWSLIYVDEFTNHQIELVLDLELLIPENWRTRLACEFVKPYWQGIKNFLIERDRACRYFYPPVSQIFAAFHHCPLDKLKGVILGMDPYPAPGLAHGLAFSVPLGIAIPSSLQNIFYELQRDLPDFKPPRDGRLTHWAEQGMLLLNSALTVTHQRPSSHALAGWKEFTKAVLQLVQDSKFNIVFFAWGQHAQRTIGEVDTQNHLLLTAPHPSGLNDNAFIGCRHFSAANTYLASKNITPFSW